MILYAACRIPITKNTAENVAIACVWMFNGVAATAAIFLGIVLKYVSLDYHFSYTMHIIDIS